MRKLNNCKICGKIADEKYNPYNKTFGHYECGEGEKQMCLTCAEKFVNSSNKRKGGHWILKKTEDTDAS